MAGTPREVTVEVNADLSAELAAGARVLAADATKKIDAGAALVYALYHHPKAVELIHSDFWSNGLSSAYIQACGAYGVGAGPGSAPIPVGPEGGER